MMTRSIRLGLATALLHVTSVSAVIAQTPPTPPDAVELKPGAAVEGELSLADTKFSGSGAAYDTYFLEGGGDTAIDLLAIATDFAPAFALFTPDGERVGMSAKGRLLAKLPTKGAYVLLVSSEQPKDLGAYRITLNLLNGERLADREMAAELNRQNLARYEAQRQEQESDRAKGEQALATYKAAVEANARANAQALADYAERVRLHEARVKQRDADYRLCLAGQKTKCMPTAQ